MPNSQKYRIEYPYVPQLKDIFDDNIDLRIHFEDGAIYWGTLFTIRNVQRLLKQEERSFFWATNMVILEDLSEESIAKAVQGLVESGYILDAFANITDAFNRGEED